MNIISLIDENIAPIHEYYNLSKTLYEEIINYLSSYKTHTLIYSQKISTLYQEFENKLNSLKEKSDDNIYNEHLFEYIKIFPNIIKKQFANYEPLFNKIELFIKDFGELMNKKVNQIKTQQEYYNLSKKNFLSKYQEIENSKTSLFNNLSLTEDTFIQFYTQKKLDRDDLIYDKKNDNETINSEKVKKLEDKVNNLIKETKKMEKNYQSFIESSKAIKQKVKENSEKTANIIHSSLNDISFKYQNDIMTIISLVKICFQEPLSMLNTYLNKFCQVNIKKELEELYKNFCNKSVTSSNIFPSKYKLKTVGLINNNNINGNIFSMEMFDDEEVSDKDNIEKEEASEINLLVIKNMYNNFTLLSANKLDLKLEEEKVQTKKLSNKLFLNIKDCNNIRRIKASPDKIFSQQDFEELEKLINKVYNRYIFLIRLTRFRSLKYDLSLKYFVIIGKLLNDIISKVEEDNDYYTAKNCVILSQTYYYLHKKEKIYLKAFIQNNPIFKMKQFWEILLESLIKNNQANSKNITENAFGNIYTLIDTMFEFGLNENEIKEIIEPKIKLYKFNNNYVKDINDLIQIKVENPDDKKDFKKNEEYLKEILEKYNKEINDELRNKEKIDNDTDKRNDNYEEKYIKNNKSSKNNLKNAATTKISKSRSQSIWEMDD